MTAEITHSASIWRLPKHALKLLALITLLTGIAACAAAGESKMYFHSFSFDTLFDAKKFGHADVEVLDFAYGDSDVSGTHANEQYKAMGQPFRSTGVAGPMPRGEFLYVKWRIKETGQICEDRVDLRHRLPADLTDYGIHFLIDGAQLYIYAFPPYETKDVFGRVTVHGGQGNVPIGGQTFRDDTFNQKYQIYPNLPK